MVFAGVFPLCSGIAAGLSLSGATIDCLHGRRYNLAGVPVYAFDARKSERLDDMIRLADVPLASDDIEVAKRAWARGDELVRFARSASRLAGTKSEKDGSFRMNIPSTVDDLILFAYTPSDEGPNFNHAYIRLDTKRLPKRVIVAFTPGCEWLF